MKVLGVNFFFETQCSVSCDCCLYAGWLKLEYPTGQNAISRQPCEILGPNFLIYMAEILLQFGIFLNNYFSFLQSYGYINILCHIINYAWNNQQQLVIFIHYQETLTVITNTTIWQVVHLAYVRSDHHQLSHKPEVFSGSSIWLCWSSPVDLQVQQTEQSHGE